MMKSSQTLEATRLVAEALKRDQGSWDEIVLRYGALVRAMVGSYRMQEADNEDAIQNTWLRAIERLPTLRDPNCFTAWLITIARRECLAVIAGTRRERPHYNVAESLADGALGPEATALLIEACGAVRVAVDGLSGKRRQMVEVLYSEQENSYLTVSNVTGMPVGSIGPLACGLCCPCVKPSNGQASTPRTRYPCDHEPIAGFARPSTKARCAVASSSIPDTCRISIISGSRSANVDHASASWRVNATGPSAAARS
jgi:RNA polymerase sigma factor (sigma-70 family)